MAARRVVKTVALTVGKTAATRVVMMAV